MKFSVPALLVLLALITMSVSTKNVSAVKGVNPGDQAPLFETVEKGSSVTFKNETGHYTLLSFWAAYDAASRFRNVKACNELKSFGSTKLSIVSISFDKSEAVFTGTIKEDGLDAVAVFQEKEGIKSEVYRKYKLKKGLRNFLIDDEGIIVAVNVNSTDLRNWIR